MFKVIIPVKQPVVANHVIEAFNKTIGELFDWGTRPLIKWAYTGPGMVKVAEAMGVSTQTEKERERKRFVFFGSEKVTEWELELRIDPMDTTKKFEKAEIWIDFGYYQHGHFWKGWQPEELEAFDVLPVIEKFLEKFDQILNELCFCQP